MKKTLKNIRCSNEGEGEMDVNFVMEYLSKYGTTFLFVLKYE